jgi:hypothetical protein
MPSLRDIRWINGLEPYPFMNGCPGDLARDNAAPRRTHHPLTAPDLKTFCGSEMFELVRDCSRQGPDIVQYEARVLAHGLLDQRKLIVIER